MLKFYERRNKNLELKEKKLEKLLTDDKWKYVLEGEKKTP